MKIGIFLPKFIPIAGGAFTFQEEIIQALASCLPGASHEFVIYSWDPLPRNSSKSPIAFQRFPRGRVGKFLHRVQTKLFKKSWIDSYLKGQGIQMLFYPSPTLLTFNIPFAMVHWDLQHRNNPYFPEVSDSGEWESREKFNRQALQKAAILFTGTQTGKEEIIRYYNVPHARIYVSPMPVPSFVKGKALYAAAVAEQVPDEPFLFYPAQFWPHKNHANVLYALAILKEEGIKPKMIFVGSDKGNKAYLTSLCQDLGLSEQVKFLGFVTRERLVGLYLKARALVFATLCGPDNLPPLEAFALGCPVLASEVPGAKDQLGSAAELFDALDPAAIASSIRKVLTDENFRQDLIRRGYQQLNGRDSESFMKVFFAALEEFQRVRRTWA